MSVTSRERVAKIFKDIIYGQVPVSRLALSIIQTPEFDRLNGLKQLGLLHKVYITANHTRFEHSIGVYHITGMYIEALVRNSGMQLEWRDLELIKIAGLVHDIGHGMFSHMFDHYFTKKLGLKQHEERGVAIFREMVNKYRLDLEPEEVDFICDLIVGTSDRKADGDEKMITSSSPSSSSTSTPSTRPSLVSTPPCDSTTKGGKESKLSTESSSSSRSSSSLTSSSSSSFFTPSMDQHSQSKSQNNATTSSTSAFSSVDSMLTPVTVPVTVGGEDKSSSSLSVATAATSVATSSSSSTSSTLGSTRSSGSVIKEGEKSKSSVDSSSSPTPSMVQQSKSKSSAITSNASATSSSSATASVDNTPAPVIAPVIDTAIAREQNSSPPTSSSSSAATVAASYSSSTFSTLTGIGSSDSAAKEGKESKSSVEPSSSSLSSSSLTSLMPSMDQLAERKSKSSTTTSVVSADTFTPVTARGEDNSSSSSETSTPHHGGKREQVSTTATQAKGKSSSSSSPATSAASNSINAITLATATAAARGEGRFFLSRSSLLTGGGGGGTSVVSARTARRARRAMRVAMLRRMKWPFEIVANKVNELDTDKMDYLQRDAYYTGIPSGLQFDRVFSWCRINKDGCIVFHQKIYPQIYDVFVTRYRLFKEAYQHKTVKAIELMAVEYLECLFRLPRVRRILSSSHGWLKFSDNILELSSIIDLLSDAEDQDKSNSDLLRRCLLIEKCIKTRTIPRIVASRVVPDSLVHRIPRHSWSQLAATAATAATSTSGGGGEQQQQQETIEYHVPFTIGFCSGNRNPLDDIRFYETSQDESKTMLRMTRKVSKILTHDTHETIILTYRMLIDTPNKGFPKEATVSDVISSHCERAVHDDGDDNHDSGGSSDGGGGSGGSGAGDEDGNDDLGDTGDGYDRVEMINELGRLHSIPDVSTLATDQRQALTEVFALKE